MWVDEEESEHLEELLHRDDDIFYLSDGIKPREVWGSPIDCHVALEPARSIIALPSCTYSDDHWTQEPLGAAALSA